MISRLSLFAALFSVLATASLAFAASGQSPSTSAQFTASAEAAKAVRIVQLERVVIVGKRLDRDAR